jgi:hypothetical protein
LFQKYGMKLKLRIAYYYGAHARAHDKSERGHPPIVNTLVKAYNGKPKYRPRLLPFALLANITTHSNVIGYMPIELIIGQKPIMFVENYVHTWLVLNWKDDITREKSLVL